MIENKVDELIAALDRNTAAVLGARASNTVVLEGHAVTGKASSPKTKKVAPKTEDETVAEVVGVTEEQVRGALNSLLKANKRNEAIALLKSFNGAVNIAGVVAEGQEAMASFIEKANEILLAA